MTKIILIEGVGPVHTQKLQEAGVRTVQALLKVGATPEGRKELAAKSGLDQDRILDWVNFADLFRAAG